ncbi:M16 family metallopeptidase [Candidatus Nitrotoga sp. M5]|uniref:M16 family metallopeptidase n=1 Tax=Candidatus Nitrotoga sp. M5 TaxID=2890409 RepID=UPI001EF196DE|nr:pitrilysin family protein [Candidatus Nitrotoga sp. M5]CAH1386297.1 Zinc protease [Candidatus Nitrotoga sp. M5]
MRIQISKYLLTITILLPAALLFSAEAQAEVFEKTLDNGLKVIVKEDHRAPVIVQQLWYRAGSMDENVGITGIAHVLEHMMFKGTKTVPVGQFSKRIAAAGGRENAFTSNDYTAYFQQLHKSELPLAMQLESDRMVNLFLTETEFSKEIKVVMEERRMRTDDEPHGLMNEKLMATAYQEHPYRTPIIGWMNDLQTLTVNDAKTWYKNWYAPNNATLVVAGDIKASEVFALAQRFYGRIPSRSLPARKHFSEPPQLGLKRIVVKAPAELPHLVMAYHAPSLRDPENDWQPYALQILSGILDGNASARLNKILVREKQLASNVGAGYDATSRGPGMFVIEGTPSEGKTVTELEEGLREQIAILKRDGVNDEELKRVKAQVTASEVYKLDSLFYQAMQIGQLESIGLSYKAIPTMLKKIQAVTAQQVQDVARKFLQDDELTIAVLEPQPLSGKPKKTNKEVTHAH